MNISAPLRNYFYDGSDQKLDTNIVNGDIRVVFMQELRVMMMMAQWVGGGEEK